MYGNIYRLSESMKLGLELTDLNRTVETQQIRIEDLRLKAAVWKANFFHKYDLAEALQSQVEENHKFCVGEFDGFCYDSIRSNAVYRTLEDMASQGLIPKSEYEFCNV